MARTRTLERRMDKNGHAYIILSTIPEEIAPLVHCVRSITAIP